MKGDVIFGQFKSDEDDIQGNSVNPHVFVTGKVGEGRGFNLKVNKV